MLAVVVIEGFMRNFVGESIFRVGKVGKLK